MNCIRINFLYFIRFGLVSININKHMCTHACTYFRHKRKKDNFRYCSSVQFSHSVVSDSMTPWTTAHKASLSITNSWSLPKLVSTELVMPFNHLILCHPILLPSIFPSIRVFSNELALHIRWPKYWSFSFNISPSSKYSD